MSTNDTMGVPPVPPATTSPTAPPPQRPSSGARTVAIVAIVLGSVIAVGGVASAAATTLVSSAVHTSSRTVDVVGIDQLDVDQNAGSLRVEYADVPEATLTVTSGLGADRWTLRRDGSELDVHAPDRSLWGWTFGFTWGGFGDHNGRAVLQLPYRLRGVDASFDVSAGELTVNGDFGRLDLTAGAGRLTAEGSAQELTADMNAGRAELNLSDVRRADLEVSAGDLDATLSGIRPDRLQLTASAGSMQVTVPQGEYDVTADTSAGSFDNRIGSTPGAANTVQVDVSAGRVVLDSAR